MTAILSRRRFIAISAAFATVSGAAPAAAPFTVWRGTALGAGATIRINHPHADRLIARARAEIDRLEGIFSLYRTDSALVGLNKTGLLSDPPFELLDCLSVCAAVHAASGGRFDPTVQPLWQLYATSFARGRAPGEDEIAAACAHVGWAGLSFDTDAVRLAPGMGLTLNGVAQGAIADRVAALFRAEGLTDILIDTGEMRALGGRPGGGDWPVRIAGTKYMEPLREAALATSAPVGTVFDAAGRVGHIIDPRTGRPAAVKWESVSVVAPTAAVADAVSTAACLLETREEILAMIAQYPGARLAYLARAAA